MLESNLTGGTKHDQNKVRMELVPPVALEEVAKVMTFGAKKYDAWNWRKGIVASRCFGAALRHMYAWWRGETVDGETGLNHLAHACCCLMFMLDQQTLGNIWQNLDDRPIIQEKQDEQ